MNLANKFTVSRIIATFVFVVLLLIDLPYTKIAATIVFICASITDGIDGRLARRLKVETDFGRLMDPLADKILISSAFIAFIGLPHANVPSWIVIIIICREFAITGLRLVSAGKGKIIPAGFWGKNKTISQITFVISVLVYLSYNELTNLITGFELDSIYIILYKYYIFFIMVVTVLLTIASGIIYFCNSWHLLKDN